MIDIDDIRSRWQLAAPFLDERDRRLFALITMNWRGKPLVSHQVIVQLIGSTTTETGLKFCCEIEATCISKGQGHR